MKVKFVLSNLPFDTGRKDIELFLKSYGIDIDIVMKHDDFGRFVGLARIEMDWRAAQQGPSELQGTEYGGRSLDVLASDLKIEDLGVRRAW